MNFYGLVGAFLAVLLLQLVTARLPDSTLDLRRKLQHSGTGIAILLIAPFLTVLQRVTLLWLGTLFVFVIVQFFRDTFVYYCGALLRPHERVGLPTAFWFILGVSISYSITSHDIAVASLLFLSFGDPAASLIGQTCGRTRLCKRKTLEGSIGFIAVSLLLSCAISTLPIEIFAAGAVSAAIAELTSALIGVDDNFSIPLTSTLVMTLFQSMNKQ